MTLRWAPPYLTENASSGTQSNSSERDTAKGKWVKVKSCVVLYIGQFDVIYVTIYIYLTLIRTKVKLVFWKFLFHEGNN